MQTTNSKCRRLTPADIDSIRSVFEETGTVGETARRTGFSLVTVARWVDRAGLPIRPPGRPGPGGRVLGEIRRLKLAGYTQRAIAAELGIGVGTVQYSLQRMGLTRRALLAAADARARA